MGWIGKLFSNLRFYVMAFSICLALGIFIWIEATIPPGAAQTAKLTQLYGLISVIYLYLALIGSPLYKVFPSLPFKGYYFKAARPVGFSAFLFAAFHSYFSFFGELGGFVGITFLNNNYLLAITLGFIGLIILTALAATSFDYMVNKLTLKRWKMIHKFVYLAGLLIVIHTLMLGTHFANLSSAIPQVFFVALGILLILEGIRLDCCLNKKFSLIPQYGVTFVIVACMVTIGAFYLFVSTQPGVASLGIHALHIQLAKDAQQNVNTLNTNFPGLQGDRTKRFTASFIPPDNPQPNQDIPLKFKIYDANSGNQVLLFLKTYAYPMHLIIVDSSLNYFEHIHPTEQGDGEFDITTQLPKPGFYHLYIQFQPLGAVEQQMAFTLAVGMNPDDKAELASQPLDSNLTKVFSDSNQPEVSYEVTLDTHGTLNASDMSLGNDKITYTIKDAKTHQPITTLKPFMASFGHLSLINQQTYDFLHVHPNNLVAPLPDANSGPNVDFMPIGIYGPIKPGIYRAFGEFSTKIGADFDTDFTIEIK